MHVRHDSVEFTTRFGRMYDTDLDACVAKFSSRPERRFMPILFYGGSFNPIHHGHLLTAQAAAEQGGFDQVLLVPSGQPPHKPDHPDLASPEHRFAMCKLAVRGSALFDVTDVEITRSGPNYTIDTARELQRKFASVYNVSAGPPSRSRDPAKDDRIAWLIGADMLNFLPQWRDPLALLAEVRFVILARPGWTFAWDTLPAEFQHLADQVVPAPLIDLSSTRIRERIRAGQSIDYQTPPDVIRYIHEHGLYREKECRP